MSSDTFRGVFTIPSTPFKQNGDVDWGDLKRVIDFCIACGAHGIVWPVNASSFPVLTDQERMDGMQMVVEHIAGRIPAILGVQGGRVVITLRCSRVTRRHWEPMASLQWPLMWNQSRTKIQWYTIIRR